MSDPLYPVTIIKTRYGGTYEGGVWAALPLDPEKVPLEATGEDVPCMIWWEKFAEALGVGASPDEALADLEAKHRAGHFYRG
jgi:hypothetical protein